MSLDERAYYLERHKRKKWRKPMPKQEFEQPALVNEPEPASEPPAPKKWAQYQLDLPWQDITDTHRNGAIIEHVLGWEIFKSGFAYQAKYEKPPNSGKWQVTPTNVALPTSAWPAQWKVFSPDHEILYLDFDPLRNRDHARRIMDYLYEGKGPRLVRFAANLLHTEIEPIDGELPWLYWMHITGRPWEPDQICQAAYEAVRAGQTSETEG